MMAFLVSSKLATLKELTETYTLEEAYWLYEILFVEKANEMLLSKRAEAEARAKKGVG